ncbi:DUF4139 domain-containing protein [[Kitasatospora] papulosa]|uniref:DUF4139 domain-containing protein n=1 Tax=[Kitasatospora] papulosa TaxID=1464011 RepID=UPI00381F7862
MLRASVAQRTGEDWTDVSLGLATADLRRGTGLPKLRSIRIGRSQPAPAPAGWREPPAGLSDLFTGYDTAPRRPAPAAQPVAPSGPPPVPPSPPAPQAHGGPPVPLSAAGRARGAPSPSAPAVTYPSRHRPPGHVRPSRTVRRACPPELPPRCSRRCSAAVSGTADRRAAAERCRARLRRAGPVRSRRAGQAQGQAVPRCAPGPGGARGPPPRRIGGRAAAAPPRGEATRIGGLLRPPIRHRCPHRHPVGRTWHTVTIGEISVGAHTEYLCTPAVEQTVYASLTLSNSSDQALLAGPVEVTVDDDFLLTAALPTLAPGGVRRVGLGPVEGVQVIRRTTLHESTSGMRNSTTVLDHRVHVELANRLAGPVTVEVRERVPVTSDPDVRIEERSDWTEPEAGSGQDHPAAGTRIRRVDLPAGGTAELDGGYEIRIPANRTVVGGNRRS